ncbi:hypothetical protein CJI97_002254 [Candidozyma auris]|uniref:hypothetical_protein n=1 Tax=Candidozyma auris TaxID=498019 RepID=UPI000C4A4602|nr:hypothetical_protein [[Candida] auris]PIS52604.1 hypothetical protein CJI97_002254 [[Candida] auris]PSK79809.1 hypothetical protein CJJ07_000169 [[Candida] auris]QEL61015.1 hypothetical protein CJJ09_003151 [[Candida] auris]QEO21881.1 hypothetical_protein [[Candida] auris]GBL51707.1 putative ubiquinone biosynthesis protein COQ7 [[Candida] auris]
MLSKRSAIQASRQLSSSRVALEGSKKKAKSKAHEYIPENVEYGSLSKAQKAFLDRVVRVDQAGELGANYIYMGQYAVLSTKFPHLKPVLQHMWDQEIHHHDTFNKLQHERRVRPSLLTPLWKIGAIGIGAGTALISKEAAMACTVAVETVIGGHYNQQLRVLMNQFNIPIYDKETKRMLTPEEITKEIETSPELADLKSTISTFRDDELEHLDTAVEHDADKAVPYMLLTETIKLICRGAIWTAERI